MDNTDTILITTLSQNKELNITSGNVGWWQGITLAPAPTVQSSAVVITVPSTTSLSISYTRGNGSSCIVLMKSGSAVNSNPVDGTTYTDSTIFGSGSQIGTGNYVIKLGSGPVTITGLTINTEYYVAVYELNGIGSTTNYLQTSPATGNKNTGKLSMAGITTLLNNGDSIAAGQRTGPPGTVPTRYAVTVAAAYGLSITETAVGGNIANEIMRLFNRKSFTPSSCVLIDEAGFNDIYKYQSSIGSLALRTRQLKGVKLATILRVCGKIGPDGLTVGTGSGHSSVTRTGTVDAFSGNFPGPDPANDFGGFKHNAGALGADCSSLNHLGSATASWSFTFTGDKIGLVMISGIAAALAGIAWGTFEVRIDGVLQTDTDASRFNLSQYNSGGMGATEQTGPVGYIFTGLTNASHTIKVDALGTGWCIVDSFVEFETRANQASIIMLEIPYATTALYPTLPVPGTIALNDNMNLMLKNEIQVPLQAAGLKIVWAPFNLNYLHDSIGTWIDSDQIHPLQLGHDNAAVNILSVMQS